HEDDLGFTRQDGIYVHFLKCGAFVVELAAGYRVQLGRQFGDCLASVGLDVSDQYVFSAAFAPNAFTQHVESLAHARRIAQEQLENPLLWLGSNLFPPLLGPPGHAGCSSSVPDLRISYNLPRGQTW